MTDLHPPEEILVDLALGDVLDDRSDEISAHLALCPGCRCEYSAIADAVEHLLPAAPQVAPPPGFSRGVLDAIGLAAPTDHDGAPPATTVAGPARATHRPARAGVLLTLAAVLVLLLAVSGALLLAGSHSPGSNLAEGVGQPLVTSAGAPVGEVTDGWYQQQPVLIVRVHDAPAGMRYECQLVLADGTRQPAGSWTIPEGGAATWVVDQPSGDVAQMVLVTPTGQPWATARL